MNKKAFTLLEVLISVLLIFMLGMALIKISSQNINILETVKKDVSYLDSLIVNSDNDYKDINSYTSIKDLPKYEATVTKKTYDLSSSSIILRDDFIINYEIKREKIEINDETKAYFRIK